VLILIIAYLGGVLTILSPCILPVLPFVFARADRPFRSHGLPMLLGMAVSFAVLASLAAVGGGWVIAVNEYGCYAAIALLAGFGVTLLLPTLADRMSRPLVSLGNRISDPRSQETANRTSIYSPVLLGVGTGLLWAPCAGPILGLILTSAALGGAGASTSLLLLVYAAGACTSLAAGLLFGGRLFSAMRGSLKTGDWIRRGAGVAVLMGVGAIAFGLDTGVLSRISLGTTSTFETALVNMIHNTRAEASASEPTVRLDDVGPLLQAAMREPGLLRRLTAKGDFPTLAGATEWVNSPPLTPELLRGKVVLVDFWTYSCINCLRTLPYVRAWAQKYKDAGLVVIGVHTPEFAFEKRSANVHRAIKDLGIEFPVAVDSDFAVRRAFGNQYWPALYFIDSRGRIRHHKFGENQYEESERVIRQLLVEAGNTSVSPGLVSVKGEGTEAAPGSTPALSDESYLGYERAQGFASPGGIVGDRSQVYRGAPTLRSNQWALSGDG